MREDNEMYLSEYEQRFTLPNAFVSKMHLTSDMRLFIGDAEGGLTEHVIDFYKKTIIQKIS